MRKKRAFTLIEILIVGFLILVVSGTLYQIFSGAFTNFFKSQTKLTNMRAASVLLEYLKRDVRLATIPTDAASQYAIASTATTLTMRFQIKDKSLHMVSYQYKDGVVTRTVSGGGTTLDRQISRAKVAAFDVSEETSGTQKFLRVKIEVDDEMNEVKRSASSKGNKITLQVVLYPRFFQNFSNLEEKFWTLARKL